MIPAPYVFEGELYKVILPCGPMDGYKNDLLADTRPTFGSR